MPNKGFTPIIIYLFIIISAIPAYSANISPEAFSQLDGCVYTTSSTTEDQRAAAVNAYSMLPANIRAGLESENCRFYLFTRQDDNSLNANHQAMSYYPTFVAYFDANGRVAEVQRQGSYFVDLVADKITRENGQSLLHETGHFVDRTFNGGYEVTLEGYNVSTLPEFNNIYVSEKDALSHIGKSSVYNVYSPEEFWAEGFACYLMYPDRVRNECPMLASMVENVIVSYNYGSNAPVQIEQTVQPVQTEQEIKEYEDTVPFGDYEEPEMEQESDAESERDLLCLPEEEPDPTKIPVRTMPKEEEKEIVARPEKMPTAKLYYKGYCYKTNPQRAQEIADKINDKNRKKAEAEKKSKAEENKEITDSRPWSELSLIEQIFIVLLGK